MKTSRRLLGLSLVAIAAICWGRVGWIEAKAFVAQKLLERAWEQALAGSGQPRPWPQADTWPVARLRAPEHDADLIVLAGASGRSLAFGPGHFAGSALPGSAGNSVVAGHRDTHFAFLERVQTGDRFELQDPSGRVTSYRVSWTQVVDQSDLSVAQPTPTDALTLVTCFPFDATVPGGPLRFVVRADRQEIGSDGRSSSQVP